MTNLDDQNPAANPDITIAPHESEVATIVQGSGQNPASFVPDDEFSDEFLPLNLVPIWEAPCCWLELEAFTYNHLEKQDLKQWELPKRNPDGTLVTNGKAGLTKSAFYHIWNNYFRTKTIPENERTFFQLVHYFYVLKHYAPTPNVKFEVKTAKSTKIVHMDRITAIIQSKRGYIAYQKDGLPNIEYLELYESVLENLRRDSVRKVLKRKELQSSLQQKHIYPYYTIIVEEQVKNTGEELNHFVGCYDSLKAADEVGNEIHKSIAPWKNMTVRRTGTEKLTVAADYTDEWIEPTDDANTLPSDEAEPIDEPIDSTYNFEHLRGVGPTINKAILSWIDDSNAECFDCNEEQIMNTLNVNEKVAAEIWHEFRKIVLS